MRTTATATVAGGCDDQLNRHIQREAARRGIPHGETDWVGLLRRHVSLGGFRGLDADAVTADIFFIVVVEPGSLWDYDATRGTTLEQRYNALAHSRVRDFRRNEGRRVRRLGEVTFTTLTRPDSDGPTYFDPADPAAPAPEQTEQSDQQQRIDGFRRWLRGRRDGNQLVTLLDARLAGEGDREVLEQMEWTVDHLQFLTLDLRQAVALWCQRFPDLSELLVQVLQKPQLSRRPVKDRRIRCLVTARGVVEARVVRYSRVRRLTQVQLVDGSKHWVDPADLLEPVYGGTGG